MTGAAPDIQALLVAALIGLLVGLERERKRETSGTIFAGIRTFPLIALFGAAVGLLAESYGALVLAAGTLAIGGLIGLSYWRVSQGPKVGGTTEVAALLVYALGVLSGQEQQLVALAGAVIASALLSLREELHEFAGGLDRADLFAVVQFAAITLIVLPLLPDVQLGPWRVWNPRQLWLLVVLISGTSFLGYAAGKLLGAGRGVILGGLLGGFASSTAVTVAHARRARQEPALARPLAVGALAANAVMAPRALVVLWVVSPALARELLAPAAALVVAIGVAVLVVQRRQRSEVTSAESLRNPFELRSALLFAVVFALFLLLVQAAREFLGDGGVVVTGALAGVSHLDAATLSLAQQVGRGLDLDLAATSATLALAANVLVKAGLAFTARDGVFIRALVVPLVLGAALTLVVLGLPPL